MDKPAASRKKKKTEKNKNNKPMNVMNRLRPQTVVPKILLALCLAAAPLAGCSGDDDPTDNPFPDEETVLTPVATHIVGKWRQATSYRMEDGTWVESPNPEGHYLTIEVRPDGTARRVDTNTANGFSYLSASPWTVDEAEPSISMGGITTPIFRLTADEFGFAYSAASPGDGTLTEGSFRWIYRRVAQSEPPHPIERLVGRWNYTACYEKVDGEWQQTTFGVPDEGWSEYRDDGTFRHYWRRGTTARSYDRRWVFNATTGEVNYLVPERPDLLESAHITLSDDGRTLSLHYTNNSDPALDETREGEFKDVFTLVDPDRPDADADKNLVRVASATINPYRTPDGKPFVPEKDTYVLHGFYGPLKLKFVPGDVLHLSVLVPTDGGEQPASGYSSAVMQADGSWKPVNGTDWPAGTRPDHMLCFYDGRQEHYTDMRSWNRAAVSCLARFEDMVNPLSYPDILTERRYEDADDPLVEPVEGLTYELEMEHNNAMLMVDRIDNRTGSDVTSITAYNYYGRASITAQTPDNELEYYPMECPFLILGPWLTTLPVNSSEDSLNELRVTLKDGTVLSVPVGGSFTSPQGELLYGMSPAVRTLYPATLTLDRDPEKCKVEFREGV